jgi:long-chain acyl-CoA synthetase
MEQVKRLFDIPYYQLQNYPKSDALCTKVNGEWVKYSTQEFINKANLFSRGLLALGVKPGDKIALISTNNRSEWNICDIGILQVGAIDVPVYPTISAADYKFIFNDAEVKLCFVSDKELYDKVNTVKNEIPSLKEIYTFNKVAGAKNWLDVLDAGMKVDIAEVEKIKNQVNEEELATLIYTSGTTGVPKGVMLSHKNIVSNAKACIERLPVDSKGKALSFLPVCHVYERMLHYLYMLTGVSVYFAESLDTIGDNLREVKPDVFTAVPRLLEKVYDKIIAKGEELSGIKRKLFFWAVSLGQQYDVVGKSAWYNFKLAIARKLIFKKWQAALGGNAKAIASGSAALQPRLARVFLAAGIPVMEGYGLTETSPVVAVNCQKNNAVRIGTVGIPIKDVQVKIAEDGEILIKGPNVMMGYYKRPDLTAEVIDSEGWLHTGDIGEMVEGKFLKITDRKKEIFKTSGGKYIAPQMMENKFKESRFIEQIMVIGENQKHPAALIVPAFAFIKEWAARKNISGLNTNEDIINHSRVKERIWQEVKEMNKNFGHWEEVKKIELLPNEWSIDGGELTPTLKLKRKFILEKYKDVVARIYS